MADRIDTLKTLLTRLIDSREGYREAVDHVDSPRLTEIFESFISRRDRDAAEVRAYLVKEGQTIADDGSLLAAAHRVFLDLKEKATGGRDAAVLQEVIRGESHLLQTYEDAQDAAGAEAPETLFLREQHAALKSAIQQLETREDLAA
ncbi:ferritin-like domain-containing protein [Jannaschia ovalis]|uniref:PA2169 family four-helix-bundle protein n=1 Tax=Jannaschia ovalis TaxID=3038773 RepID=A0ABY8LE84_9RHOB|nr:PA2169 family four-helix-bundle protein [Jannaschia sp. GRR-S6-38]WGH79471.1 PA2169 family four-helix-bundle protein [Jannaschia sp. GRR-S6-38]